MLFSAYQIESLLADFLQKNSTAVISTSENLSLSADSIQNARKYLRLPKRTTLDWVSPKDIMKLVEDHSSYDPVIDNVQQSRAGRFVVPTYVPEIPAPVFPLVGKHTQQASKSETTVHESSESPATEEDNHFPEKNTESDEVEEKASVSLSEEVLEENILINQTNQGANKIEESAHREPVEPNASFFDGIDDDDEHDDEHDDEELRGDNSEENDVVFGEGRIDQKSMRDFVANYPDSTIKFLMRKNLDGKPLPVGYEEIYSQWEKRGLSRGRLKKYLYKIMDWKHFPDIPVHDVVKKIREHHYFLEII